MTPHCQLYGITCNENGYVTKLNLKGNNVVGLGFNVFFRLLGDFTEIKVFYQAILGQAFLKLECMDLSGNSIAGCFSTVLLEVKRTNSLHQRYREDWIIFSILERVFPVY